MITTSTIPGVAILRKGGVVNLTNVYLRNNELVLPTRSHIGLRHRLVIEALVTKKTTGGDSGQTTTLLPGACEEGTTDVMGGWKKDCRFCCGPSWQMVGFLASLCP